MNGMTAFKWPDARGWVGLACFVLVLIILAMVWFDRSLLNNDFFKLIAQAILMTAWLGGPVGWAYQATKTGNDLATKNADIVTASAASSPPISGDATAKAALADPPIPPTAAR